MLHAGRIAYGSTMASLKNWQAAESLQVWAQVPTQQDAAPQWHAEGTGQSAMLMQQPVQQAVQLHARAVPPQPGSRPNILTGSGAVLTCTGLHDGCSSYRRRQGSME